MEANVLKQIAVEDVIFFAENQYDRINRLKYLAVFEELVADGRLTGKYNDKEWIGFSGIKRFGINFEMDETSYKKHFGKAFGIKYATMQDMLRCYVLYIIGSYIFPTIKNKLAFVKEFMTTFGEADVVLPVDAAEAIQDFLLYIGTPEKVIQDSLRRIYFQQERKSRPRELAHLINYLAIANEINELYRSELSDEEFKKWFPVFFWTKITFVVPLRATEMLVTPFTCIKRDAQGRVTLTLRRTTLKGKGSIVRYDVKKDYKDFQYEIPDDWVVEAIERYQQITADHQREFLFDHTKYMINKIVSLSSFNMLLEEFVKTRLIGNSNYDYARFATGIKEFEYVTAGDSRPIAMANLYFQGISADICRQLANHSQISTSFGYYTNISNTIQCASVMEVQRRINHERYQIGEAELAHVAARQKERALSVSRCLSPRQPMMTGDIHDCLAEHHLNDCLGCRYYAPSETELKIALGERKAAMDEVSKRLITYIAETCGDKDTSFDMDSKLELDIYTNAIRLKRVADEYAEEAEYKWRRHRSSQMKNS